MKKTNIALTALAAALLTACNAADNTAPAAGTSAHGTTSLEACMQAALAQYPGYVQTLEAEISQGKPIFEFDIRTADGKEWEVECDAATAAVIEVEEELAADDARFASAAISSAQAQQAALAVHAGDILETEYAVEADGSLSYEFDIKTADGKEMEVEIDAASGEVEEQPEQEIYQIGEEK